MASTFLTEVKHDGGAGISINEVGDLEGIALTGVTQTSQSTLLLQKRKEMREVDDALELMKEDYHQRMDECNKRQKDYERQQ